MTQKDKNIDANGLPLLEAPERLERFLAFLDRLYERRTALHRGDEQAAVMRVLTRACLIDGEPGVSLHALSKQTGVPRETLRRKIGTLINRAYVEQDEEKRYRPTVKYRLDSQAAILETGRELLTLAEDLKPMVERLERAGR